MSPKSIQYSTNSIIYFKGDINENIYILKAGKVDLVTNDIETGQEIHDLIQTGEFFGVKSALGKYPREETVVVLRDAMVIMFSIGEFEQFVLKNTRIIMKMLKVFSNQLRRTHKQVQNLLNADEAGTNPETGLFRIGEHYIKEKKYSQALYTLKRYLTYYPSGKHLKEVTQCISIAERKAQNLPAPEHVSSSGSIGSNTKLSDVAKLYYNGVSIFGQQKYTDALKIFSKIVENGADAEYTAKSIYEIGRCFYHLNNFDQCIKQFTLLVQKFPKHPDLNDALYHVGSCYEKKGNMEKAIGFYKKILSISSADSSPYRKAKKSLQSLERK